MDLKITIPDDAVEVFDKGAKAAGLDRQAFALDAILDRLETTARYRTLMSRQEQIDSAILQLAELVGSIAQAAESEQQADICKFRPCSSGASAAR